MNRRSFLKTGIAGAGILGASILLDCKGKNDDLNNGKNGSNVKHDLVAVRGGNPDIMFDKGIDAYGGMGRFVKEGQTVVIKPNIAFNRTPDFAASTHPMLIKRIVEHCYNAGAKKVYVFDHTADTNWKGCYSLSGIEKVVNDANGQMVPGNSESYYQEIQIENANILKKTKVHEVILDSDVFINVPILKHHGGTTLTIAMKNLMGIVWDRSFYHSRGLSQCIAEFCLYRKPDLNIVDAYNIMTTSGPRGGVNLSHVKTVKNQLISTDILAIDEAATQIFNKATDNSYNPYYMQLAEQMGIGVKNLKKIKIKKISV